jgi:pilus assembly protein CpaF
MLVISVESPTTIPQVIEVHSLPCRIGKAPKNEVSLPSWRVSKVHAEIRASRVGVKLVDLGSIGGTWVNGERIAEYGPLSDADEILIAGFKLRVLSSESTTALLATSIDDSTSSGAGVPSVGTMTSLVAVTQKTAADASRSKQATWQKTFQRRLFEKVDFRRQDFNTLNPSQLRIEVGALVDQLIEDSDDLPDDIDHEVLREKVIDEAIGLGPLEPLLADASVTEIMVNGPDEVFVERHGKLTKSDLQFSSPEALRAIIDRIVSPLGRRIDESSPMVDARLPDGSRVNVVIAPLAINGATVTIRKFSKTVLTTESLVALGSATPAMTKFFELCVKSRKNIVISGGTGSGKTTLLNVLSNLIPDGERVLTIEDAAELRLAHSHWVSLESRPANAEGKGIVGIRDLVRNALRMRPDRIVVGEVRGDEAIDMLQAMNTGHDGSLTTVHANSPRDALRRLEAMVLMAGFEMPLQAVREQIVGAIDFIIHQSRMASGARMITEVIEVVGMETQRIQTQSIFKYDVVKQQILPCDTIPQFFEELTFTSEAERQQYLALFSLTSVREVSHAA